MGYSNSRQEAISAFPGKLSPLLLVVLSTGLAILAGGEILTAKAQSAADAKPADQTITLSIPQGSAIQVVIDKDIHVKTSGEEVDGRVLEPVYAFDKLVIPTNSKVTGHITSITSVSRVNRTKAALDADLTPARKVEVEFTTITLPAGKQIAIRTHVTPASGQVLEFVSAADENRKHGAADTMEQKIRVAKQEAKREWDSAMQGVQGSGKVHRAERYTVAQLPVHPQYIDAGTVYFAEIQQPLDFGVEPLTPETSALLSALPPDGTVVTAQLETPLNSATAQVGDPVGAMISRPVFQGGRLILPQGSRLLGTIVQVQRAHHPARNGELRIAFRSLQLPNGADQKVVASLEGIESAKQANARLDAEGGARSTPPPARFLTTATSVGLGAASFLGDSFGETGPRASGGASGYKLIGIGLGLAIHSQPFGMAMGAFGGSRAIYLSFIAKGHDIVFPKNTVVKIGIGSHPAAENTTKD